MIFDLHEYTLHGSDIDAWNTETRKRSLMRFLAVFAPTVIIFSIFNIIAGNYVIGYLEASLAVSAFISWKGIQHLKLSTMEQAAVAQIAILTYAFLFFNAVGNNAYIWSMAFPFFATYLLGIQRGIKWIIGFALITSSTSFMLWQMGQQLYWPWEMAPYFLVDYGIIALLAYFFFLQTEKYAQLLKKLTLQSKADADALIESQNRYQALLKSSLHAIMITDAKSVILDVNHAFEAVTGYSAEEARGNKPSILHSNKQDQTFYQQMWHTISTHGQWEGEIWNKRKNGETYPEHLSISAIHNSQGEVVNYVGIFSDISEKLSIEEQLRQSQKMEAVGTLVGGIAHDFNNMLAGMTGNLYLAKQKVQQQPDVLQKLISIEQLSRRAADMIQQLLTFARKGIVSKKAMSLTPFIKESMRFFHTTLPENINIIENICTENLPIHGDNTQIHQILMNLINNARDAVEGLHEPRITIGLKPFTADKLFLTSHPYFKQHAYAHLSISDNGSGIGKETIAHIFEPFYTTKEQGKGTGLGLSMVYGAIQTHDGFVEVDSTEDQGTTFNLYIPLIEGCETASQASPQETTCKGQNELILIADDEPVVRETMNEVLQSLGYRTLMAEDGLMALELFKQHQQDIDLALLDVVMPHLGGVQLATRIKAIQSKLPIIFLTGYDKEHVLNGSKPLNNTAILTKPISLDVLSQKIRQMLG